MASFAGELGSTMILWPGVEGYNYPFQTPYAESWARFIDGVGQVASRCAERRHRAVPRAQELRARDEDLHAEHRHDAPRDPHAARAGDRQREGQHGLAAPDHERREPRRVRGAARSGRAARPSARELRLGHVRRRQHGRRDRVHGDARARDRASPRRIRRQRRAARVRPLPVHRGRGRRGEAFGAAVAVHRRCRSADRRGRAAQGAAGEGRCPRVRARVRAPSGRDGARSGSTSARPASRGSQSTATAQCWPSPKSRIRSRHRSPAGRSRIRRTGGAHRRQCWRGFRRGLSACPARCTGSSSSTKRIVSSAPRSSGTTSAPAPSARTSRSGSGSSG